MEYNPFGVQTPLNDNGVGFHSPGSQRAPWVRTSAITPTIPAPGTLAPELHIEPGGAPLHPATTEYPTMRCATTQPAGARIRTRTDRTTKAVARMADELHRHLADITALHQEVTQARTPGRDPLFDDHT